MGRDQKQPRLGKCGYLSQLSALFISGLACCRGPTGGRPQRSHISCLAKGFRAPRGLRRRRQWAVFAAAISRSSSPCRSTSRIGSHLKINICYRPKFSLGENTQKKKPRERERDAVTETHGGEPRGCDRFKVGKCQPLLREACGTMGSDLSCTLSCQSVRSVR